MLSTALKFSTALTRQTRVSTTQRPSVLGALLSTNANQHNATDKIGFVGLGNMGLPMCLNLITNHTVDHTSPNGSTETIIAYDLNPDAVAKAAAGGATPASDLKDIADCSIIITSLPSCAAVENVLGALLESIPANSPQRITSNTLPRIFIDTSTVNPLLSRSLFDDAFKNGHILVDAPVSGGVKGAEDGTLTFMVGSDSNTETFDRISPYLRRMGKRVIGCGGPGTGSAAKLCNNLALASQMIGVCEAINLGEELGVDPIVLADVMNSSTAKCWSSEVCNPHPSVATARGPGKMPASKEYEGGFSTKLMLKDVGLAVAAADELGVVLPLGSASKQLYQLADISGMGSKDFGVMLQYLRGKKV